MYSSSIFVLIVAGFYIALAPIPQRWFPTVFGGLNLVALGLLFGGRMAAIAALLTFGLWFALAAAKHSGVIASKNKVVKLGTFYGLIALVLSVTFLSDIEAALAAGLREDGVTAVRLFLILGISYLGLRLWDCVFAVFDGARLMNPLALAGYIMPFFMVMAGPIGSYQDHLKVADRARTYPGFRHFIDCIFLISLGYAMKFFFAELYQLGMAGPYGKWRLDTPWETWLYLAYILLEFWGYSLIALGVGRLLGVATPVNFNHPYFATTVGEFWTRWHISLGGFVARNIYNPMMLFLVRRIDRKSKRLLFASNLLALWLPFIFTGLWHHISWGFFWWGLLVGLIVAGEKALWEFKQVKTALRAKPFTGATITWRIVGIVYTQAMIALTLSLAIKEFQAA